MLGIVEGGEKPGLRWLWSIRAEPPANWPAAHCEELAQQLLATVLFQLIPNRLPTHAKFFSQGAFGPA